jgi:hypothetical protein
MPSLPLCVLLLNGFSSSKGFSELVPASTGSESSLKFPFLQFELHDPKHLTVMLYHFQLAFEQFSDHQNLPYIHGKRDLPATNICVVPVSNDPGDVKLFSNFRAANQIRSRCPSNIPSFKQYGQCIVTDNCKKLAAVMYRITFQMQPKHRP